MEGLNPIHSGSWEKGTKGQEEGARGLEWGGRGTAPWSEAEQQAEGK